MQIGRQNSIFTSCYNKYFKCSMDVKIAYLLFFLSNFSSVDKTSKQHIYQLLYKVFQMQQGRQKRIFTCSYIKYFKCIKDVKIAYLLAILTSISSAARSSKQHIYQLLYQVFQVQQRCQNSIFNSCYNKYFKCRQDIKILCLLAFITSISSADRTSKQHINQLLYQVFQLQTERQNSIFTSFYNKYFRCRQDVKIAYLLAVITSISSADRTSKQHIYQLLYQVFQLQIGRQNSIFTNCYNKYFMCSKDVKIAYLLAVITKISSVDRTSKQHIYQLL